MSGAVKVLRTGDPYLKAQRGAVLVHLWQSGKVAIAYDPLDTVDKVPDKPARDSMVGFLLLYLFLIALQGAMQVYCLAYMESVCLPLRTGSVSKHRSNRICFLPCNSTRCFFIQPHGCTTFTSTRLAQLVRTKSPSLTRLPIQFILHLKHAVPIHATQAHSCFTW